MMETMGLSAARILGLIPISRPKGMPTTALRTKPVSTRLALNLDVGPEHGLGTAGELGHALQDGAGGRQEEGIDQAGTYQQLPTAQENQQACRAECQDLPEGAVPGSRSRRTQSRNAGLRGNAPICSCRMARM
jgi:hypothetical protein